MATRTAKLNIEVSGEQRYKQAIAELNRGNQVLNAEMKKLAEQYKGNETSMEAMRAKSDLLQRQLQQQRDKVQTLRDALQNAATQYGEADRRTQSWQTQLLNAERDEIKLQRALEDCNQAIEGQSIAAQDASEELIGLGDIGDNLAGIFGGHIPDALRDSLNEMGSFSTETVALIGQIGPAVGLAATAIEKLYSMTVEAAGAADELLTRSAQTGLSTDLLQQLDYAQRFLDFDGIDTSLQKLTTSMGNAAAGARDQSQAFAELGVEIYDEDGKLRNNYDVMLDVIDALGNVENETQRDILANQLFGKSYTDLKPLIQAGSTELKAYTDRAQEMGYVIDEKVVKALGRLDDALQENRTATETAKTEAAGFFAPIFQSIVDLGTGATNAVRGLFSNEVFQGMESFINPAYGYLSVWSSIANAVYEAKDAQDAAAESAGVDASKISAATGTMQEAVSALAETYREAYEAALETLDGQFGLFENASERLTTVTEEAQQQIQKFWETSYEAAEKSLQGQFGLFDEASGEFEKGASDIIAALESQITYWNEYKQNLDTVLSSGIEGIREFVAAHADGSAESVQAIAALASATDEERTKIVSSWRELQEKQSELAGSFATLKTEGAADMNELAGAAGTSVSDMAAAIDSQREYWESYAQDLEALKGRNIEGVDELAAKFADGSEQSKDALAALSTATDTEIEQLIASMEKTDEAKRNLAQRFADLAVDVPDELAKIKTAFAEDVETISETAGGVDFDPFETAVSDAFSFLDETSSTSIASLDETLASVNYEPFESSADAAFGYLEARCASAVSNVHAMLASLYAEMDAAESRAQSVGHNAAGTDSWRGGLTWVGEQGPELVSLPQGSRIYSNRESERIAVSGSDTSRMEALMEQNVRLLERISLEFSGLRVKGRMA